MKKQEIFDKVVKHLLGAADRSIDPATRACRYRGPNGAKCAVGAVLPDEYYNPEMDAAGGLTVWGLTQRPMIPYWMKRNVALLDALQQAHDHPDNWFDNKRGLIAKLHEIAKKFKLKKTALPPKV